MPRVIDKNIESNSSIFLASKTIKQKPNKKIFKLMRTKAKQSDKKSVEEEILIRKND